MRNRPKELEGYPNGVRRRPSQPQIRPGREHSGRDSGIWSTLTFPGEITSKVFSGFVWDYKPVFSLAVRCPIVPAKAQADSQPWRNPEPVVGVES